MNQQILEATFIGEDESLGYRKGQVYVFTLTHNYFDGSSTVFSQGTQHPCVYSSAYSFIKNWTNITHK